VLSLGIPVLGLVGSLLLFVIHPDSSSWKFPFVIACIIWAGGIVMTFAGIVQGHRAWSLLRKRRKKDKRAQRLAIVALVIGYGMVALAIAEGALVSLLFGALGLLNSNA